MTRLPSAAPSATAFPRYTASARAMRLALLAFAASASPGALAVPLTTQLPVPNASFVQAGTVTNPSTDLITNIMTVKQTSAFAVVNWDSFSIGADAGVVFDQPNASAVILNRVVTLNQPSEIFGTITATGTVGIFNPAGVLFGAGSAINVGSLIASTLTPSWTLNGKDVTVGLDTDTDTDGDASVINQGDIVATNGDVLMIGRQVTNEGTISSDGKGSVTLDGADSGSLLLDFKVKTSVRRVGLTSDGPIAATSSGGTAGVTNTGTITSRTIVLTADIAPGLLDHVVNNSGLLVASGVDLDGQRAGGTVRLVASGAGIDGTGGQATSTGFGANADGQVVVDSDGDVTMGLADAGDTGVVNLTSDGAITDGNGASVNVRAGSTVINAAGQIDLDTEVANLAARSTGDGIAIDEADGLDSANLRTADDLITLTANGSIDLLSITSLDGSGGEGATVTTSTGDIAIGKIRMGDQAAGAETVRLEATNGAIVDEVQDFKVDVESGITELVAGTGIGTAGDALDLAGRVDLTVTGAGDINVRGSSFTGLSAETANGSITARGGTIVAENVVSLNDADANNIIIVATGDVEVGHVSAGTTAGDVVIRSDGSILEATDEAINIAGDRVILDAKGNVGFPVGTGALTTLANDLIVSASLPGVGIYVALAELDDVRFRFDGFAPVTLDAGGSIDVLAINNPFDLTHLTAGGAITGGNRPGLQVTTSVLELSAVDGIDLDGNIEMLQAEVTGAGDLAYAEADDVAVTNATTADGQIRLTASNTVNLEHVRSNGGGNEDDIHVNAGNIQLNGLGEPAVVADANGDVFLTATTASIVDAQSGSDGVDVQGDRVTMTALNGDIGNGGTTTGEFVETRARSLDLTTDFGSINVAEADNVRLDATAGDGSIIVSAGGDLRVGLIDVGTAGSPDDSDVTLTSTGGRILDDVDDAQTDIVADHLVLNARDGVGGGTGTLDTAVNSLSSTLTTSGGLRVDQSGAVALTASIDAGGGDVELTGGTITAGAISNADVVDLRSTGDLLIGTIQGNTARLQSGGSIVDDNGDTTNVTAADLRALAETGIDLDTAIDTLRAISNGGDILLTEVDNLKVREITTLGHVTLASGGAISNGNSGIVTATSLDITAVNGVDLASDIDTLEGTVTGPGDFKLVNTGNLTITNLEAADGDVTVQTFSGIVANRVVGNHVSLEAFGEDIQLRTVHGDTVNLSANEAIRDLNGGAANVFADDLKMRAGTGINIDTNVDTLAAQITGVGPIVIEEVNGLTLGKVTNPDGDITIGVGGTMRVGSIDAGNGGVHLTAGGAIVDDIDDAKADIRGGSVDLAAGDGIGGGAGGTLDTAADTLSLFASTGDIAVAEQDAMTLTGAQAADGNLLLTARGPLTVDAASASGALTLRAFGTGSDLLVGQVGGDTVTLHAGNEIVDNNAETTNVTGGTLVASSAAGIDLDTAVDSIRATTTGNGVITLDETDAVTLARVSTQGGAVFVTTGGALTAALVSSGGGDIALEAKAGDLVAGNINAGSGNVNLVANTVAGQRVLDDGRSGTRISGSTLFADADAGIGATDAALGTDVAFLSADAGTGALVVREVDGITLEKAVTNGGTVSVRAGGNLVAGNVNAGTGDIVLASDDGTITDDGLTGTRVIGGSLTARAQNGVSLDTRVQRVSARTTTGDVRIDDQGGNLEVEAVRGDAVTLTSSGALVGAGDATNVRANTLIATAAAGIDLSTSVDTVTATVTDTGDITLSETGAIELADVSTAAGDVTVNSGGNLVTGTVRGDTTRLTSGGAISDGNGVGTVNVTGDVLIASAQNGIDLDTEVATIRRATTVNGSVTIREATSAALGTIQGNAVSLTAGGALTDENGDATNVTTSTLMVRAVDGIDLDTDVVTLDAEVTGGGDLDIANADTLRILNARTDDGDLHLATANNGNLVILDAGQIDAGDGDITLDIAGAVRQESRRTVAAISGGSLTIDAGGNVGQLLVPLNVDIDDQVTINFDSDRPVALITGIFGSLNEGDQVFALGQNTELSNSVGAIQSSFQKTVTFNLDSSQFATQTRIYTTEGTGILLPEEVRE